MTAFLKAGDSETMLCDDVVGDELMVGEVALENWFQVPDKW